MSCSQTAHDSMTSDQNVEWVLADIFQDKSDQTSFVGNPKLSNSPYGKAVHFDGVDDGIYLDEMPLDQMEAFTIEMIFNPDADAAPFEQRIVHIGEVSEDRLLLEIRAMDGQWYFDGFISSGENGLALIEDYLLHPLGEWHHVALVVEKDRMTTYVNGKKELSEPFTYRPIKTGKTSLGVRQNKRSWYKGAIYNVTITPEALSEKDFKTN